MSRMIDISLLPGLRFKCLPNCGLCCAFRPQVGDFELDVARNNPVVGPRLVEEIDSDGFVEHYLPLHRSPDGTTGACAYIGSDRLCTIYEKRFLKCHLYPYYLRFSDRVQVDVDLACSGIWTTDEDAVDLYKNVSSILRDVCGYDEATDTFRADHPAGVKFSKILNRTRADHDLACRKLMEKDLYYPVENCRWVASVELDRMTSPVQLESILYDIGNNPQIRSKADIETGPAPGFGLVEGFSAQIVENAFIGKERPVDYPLFMDVDMGWEYIALDRNSREYIIGRFDQSGTRREISRAAYIKPPLTPLPPDARRLLRWYGGFLNARQSTYDFAMLSSVEAMSNTLLGAYVYVLSLFLIEAWSWASVYSYLKKIPMNAYVLRKGIQASDNARVTGPSFDVI